VPLGPVTEPEHVVRMAIAPRPAFIAAIRSRAYAHSTTGVLSPKGSEGMWGFATRDWIPLLSLPREGRLSLLTPAGTVCLASVVQSHLLSAQRVLQEPLGLFMFSDEHHAPTIYRTQYP